MSVGRKLANKMTAKKKIAQDSQFEAPKLLKTSGNFSTSATSGYYSTSATSGYYSTSATSGNFSTSATSGNYSKASATGMASPAVCAGVNSRAKAGKFGCVALGWMNIKENRREMRCREIGCGDGSDGKLKADVWYELDAAGDFKEVA